MLTHVFSLDVGTGSNVVDCWSVISTSCWKIVAADFNINFTLKPPTTVALNKWYFPMFPGWKGHPKATWTLTKWWIPMGRTVGRFTYTPNSRKYIPYMDPMGFWVLKDLLVVYWKKVQVRSWLCKGTPNANPSSGKWGEEFPEGMTLGLGTLKFPW